MALRATLRYQKSRNNFELINSGCKPLYARHGKQKKAQHPYFKPLALAIRRNWERFPNLWERSTLQH
jgi:3-methyladenine DNA glycosylase AlkD